MNKGKLEESNDKEYISNNNEVDIYDHRCRSLSKKVCIADCILNSSVYICQM